MGLHSEDNYSVEISDPLPNLSRFTYLKFGNFWYPEGQRDRGTRGAEGQSSWRDRVVGGAEWPERKEAMDLSHVLQSVGFLVCDTL